MLNKSNDTKPIRDSTKEKQDKTGDAAKDTGRKQDTENTRVKDVLTRIEDTAKNGRELIKSSPYWESIKSGTSKIKEKSIEQEAKFKKQSPKIYKKITNGFFYFFEAVIGRIRVGLQYGNPSLETLERLAKLKELGILTDEEFAKKKKKVLDRI